ncbi:MAG: hypothetical protein LBI42_10245 [Chitinispirillales bacterium]|jgi:hypothetical protein|nr:hypothetical protein [Chitinispirillales bacterium]
MEIITNYNPDNAHLIDRYDRERVAKCSTEAKLSDEFVNRRNLVTC